ncbi:MAG TPA: transposase [Bacteroidia bacterium]|nr:transposase [Bacteroidia bacterium]
MVHAIWSTKNRFPLITKELKPVLLQHIKENSIKKNIYIDTHNCVSDHIHLLISLGADQPIAKTIGLIKGESSNWINKHQLSKTKFEWQEEYIALSVSVSMIDKVRGYILKQEEHHKKRTFTEEYQEFIKSSNLA